MNIPPDRLILLDTTILVHLARNDATGQKIEKEFHLADRPERPLISTVTEGEILGLARYWKWGPAKLAALNKIIGEFVRVNAGLREIVETYADLYAKGTSSGLPCGENDLWIAATVKSVNAILLTGDTHFDWMHPAHINRIYIPDDFAGI